MKENFKEYEPIDLGTNSKDSVDYPIFGHRVGKAVVENKAIGILVCGSGIGIGIAANKVPGVRCALCHDVTTARLCREVCLTFFFPYALCFSLSNLPQQHNDANIISMGERIIGLQVAKDIVATFLKTPASTEGRHQIRVGMLEDLTAC